MNAYERQKEYGYLMNLLSEEYCRFSKNWIKIIRNIPDMPVSNFISNEDKVLYEIKFIRRDSSWASHSRKYSFSFRKTAYLKEVMLSFSKKLRERMGEFIKDIKLTQFSDEEIKEIVNGFGFKEIEIRELSENEKLKILSQEPIRLNRHNKNRLSEMKGLKLYRPLPETIECRFCRDGGCVHCEPHRFITDFVY